MKWFIIAFIAIISILIIIKVIQTDYPLSNIFTFNQNNHNVFSYNGVLFSLITTEENTDENKSVQSLISKNPEKNEDQSNSMVDLLMNIIMSRVKETESGSNSNIINQITKLIDNLTGSKSNKPIILKGNWTLQSTDSDSINFSASINEINSEFISERSFELKNLKIDRILKLTSDNNNYFILGKIDIVDLSTKISENIEIFLIIHGNSINIILEPEVIGDYYNGQPIFGSVTK
ncbi:MAG: hypothetical protein DA328_03325 [Nitrososphaeraceae archaeon]|nr:hypothetical protein [Nitrososphaeraceae archaeon]